MSIRLWFPDFTFMIYGEKDGNEMRLNCSMEKQFFAVSDDEEHPSDKRRKEVENKMKIITEDVIP